MAKILRAVEWQVEHFADVPVVVVACLRGGRPPLVRGAIASTFFVGGARERGERTVRFDPRRVVDEVGCPMPAPVPILPRSPAAQSTPVALE